MDHKVYKDENSKAHHARKNQAHSPMVFRRVDDKKAASQGYTRGKYAPDTPALQAKEKARVAKAMKTLNSLNAR